MQQHVYKLAVSDGWGWVTWADEDDGDLATSFGRQPLAPSWRPQTLIRARDDGEPELPLGDMPHHVYSAVLVMSSRAVGAFRDLLPRGTEILPLESSLGDFAAINLLNTIDCLDYANAKVERFESSGRVMHIEKYAFNPERIRRSAIFRIPERVGATFVTQAFVDRAYDAGLDGVFAVEVWPDEDPKLRRPW